MHEQILEPLTTVWRQHRASLHDALTKTIEELNNLLRLDEYHRHGHESPSLEQTVGAWGAHQLDLNQLSAVLGTGGRSRAMPAERLERVNALRETLTELSQRCEDPSVQPAVVDLSEPLPEIEERAKAHFDRMATVFRALRVAQLEIRSKYETAVHDAVFAAFDWRDLGPAELKLCPPFLVTAELGVTHGEVLRKIAALLESRLPLKVAVLRTALQKHYAKACDVGGPPGALALEMLPMALRGVTFLQSCVAAPEHAEQLARALTSPRPGVISLLDQKPGESPEALAMRAERAVHSRTFPLFSYDPDRSRHFVSCFDLQTNPQPELPWVVERVQVTDRDGQVVETEEAYTFAHYAFTQPEFAAEFSPAPAKADHLVRLVDYLEFSRPQRVGKAPFITLKTPEGETRQLVVSAEVALQCGDMAHLWRTLQEISGVQNPHINSTRFELNQSFGVKQEASLQQLRDELEEDARRREKLAVAQAVQTLVARFTGVDESQIAIEQLMAATAK